MLSLTMLFFHNLYVYTHNYNGSCSEYSGTSLLRTLLEPHPVSEKPEFGIMAHLVTM